MKIFISSLLLFFTLNLFAQPQKGDLYIGFSNLRLSNSQRIDRGAFSGFSQSSFSISPTFGRFITNSTLIGGGFSFFTNLSDLSIGSTPANFFNINLLGAQYFGKGELKGLTQLSLNSNLITNGFSNTRRNITGSLGIGGAYFVNEFTSLQLLYGINIFNAQEGLKTEYFTNDIDPNLALTLRIFLLRNREGIENLSALNSIKKGTKRVGITATLRNINNSYSHSYGGAFTYFFADNLYGDIGLASSLSKNEEFNAKSSNVDFSLNAGYYLKITDKFYGKFVAGMRNKSQFSEFLFNGIQTTTTNLNAMRWNADLGVAIFLGRHKIEPGIGFRMSRTRLKEVNIERISDFSPNIFIDYEWFLAENFTFATQANLRINNVSYFLFNDLEIFEFTRNDTNLNVGFKWYLSTPSE